MSTSLNWEEAGALGLDQFEDLMGYQEKHPPLHLAFKAFSDAFFRNPEESEEPEQHAANDSDLSWFVNAANSGR
jgi:hypothetical protein